MRGGDLGGVRGLCGRRGGRGEQRLRNGLQEVKRLVSLVGDVEKDEDVLRDPKDVGLVHDEESLETPKKLKGTALR